MKPIEISQEQKEKLLEMCKELFEEYKPDINDSGFIYLWELDTRPSLCVRLQKGNMFVKIHWFEFCMTHLLKKIFSMVPKEDKKVAANTISQLYWAITNYELIGIKAHPVDYLYQEFLKLNKC